MKKITLLVLIFINFPLMAQDLTVDISGDSCDGLHDFTFLANFNGKKYYTTPPWIPLCRLSLGWRNNRWEVLRESGDPFTPSELLFFNTADTVLPPCNSGWIATENCPSCSFSILSGDCDSSITNANSTDIPTLSQWGLIILALLLMTFGTLQLINRESKETT